MKKTLALVLALAMVFSTITVAFAEGTIGGDAQICADLGMLKGSTGTVDAAYTATAPTRIQAAVMFLRLKGLEAEAKAFTGAANFADADKAAWAIPVMAYLKANPQLGWMGDGTNFDPMGLTTAQAYYKVMLEALGYKQTTAEVVGDFAYADVVAFAAGKGLAKVAAVTNFTVNDLATATVEALKANMKDGGKTLVASLVEADKIDNAKAVAAGLVVEEPEAVAATVDSVTAIGNTVVEVVFEEDVDAASAGDVANYAIEGLAINAAVVVGSDTVRLETAAQTAGKLYTLAVGAENVKFTGVPKVTGAPAIKTTVSDDIEEVVITFTKNIDLVTGTDVANYTIEGVEIASADVDGKDVTLTTVGLAARKQYTVKVKNVKAVDGGLLKSASDTFYTRPDTTAPKLVGDVDTQTNQRFVLIFDETLTTESAENIENYTIKTVTGDAELAVVSAVLKSSGTNKNKQVTITTEVQTANKKYELSINNLVNRKKSANTITKAIKKTFFGVKEDTTKPSFASATPISRDLIKVVFTDSSMIEEAGVLDASSYTLKKGSTEFVVENVEKVSSKNGEFVALLTVEAMPVGSYSLEAEAIADEFDNELSATKRYFTVNNDTFASASLKAVKITGENEITLTFDKELNADSAEDIANYSINKEIGAPLSAEYDDANPYLVVLETNDLNDNVTYKVTIDGVVDLAGNVLNHQFGAVKNDAAIGWDEDPSKLEDAYSVNKHVVALAFDEAVKYTAGTTLTLRPNLASPTGEVLLAAKALASDDTVVEFSNFATTLADNVTYKVYSLVYNVVYNAGITDVAGNAFVLPADIASFEVYGTSENPEKAEIVSITQTNGKTFELKMSKYLTPASGSVTSTGTVATFNWAVDADDTDVVTFTKTGTKITENAEYQIDLSAFLKDEHGIGVLDDGEDLVNVKTTFYAEYQDDDKPYIVNVVAADRYTVEIEYSEEVTGLTNGTYTVKNTDTDVSKANMVLTASSDTDDAKIVVIKLSAPLQSIYDYELTIILLNVVDLAGTVPNAAEEILNETFSFNGTDLAQ